MSSSPPGKKGSPDFCRIMRPAAWAAAEKQRQYGSGAGLDRRGTAVSSDGETLFAVETAKGKSDLVRLQDKGRERQVVHSLNPAMNGKKAQYGSMRFDGRWLVFEVSHDAENWNDWTLYAWDSTGGSAPFRVTRHDKAVQGPFLFVHVRDGKAAWTEGVRGGKKAIHLYDLARRKDTVVRTGQVSPVFLSGDLLGWREAPAPEAPVRLKAVSVRTGEPADLPAVIAKIRGAAHVSGDGTTWAWVSPDYQTLYAWKPGWKQSATIAKAGGEEHIDQMEIAGDLVTWTGGKAIWAADLRTHSRTTLTPEYGSVVAHGDSLLVTYLNGGYTKDAGQKKGTTSYVLKEPELPPLSNCSSWTPVPQPPTETGAPGTEAGVPV
ncbi:hypothetical protein ACFY9C_22665 [Streptomyces filamentosus]|uniref:hypothetical protein n=1 Tax=Streptomyces filamentosus TaxID=67294 RepID=UPI0036E7C382